MKVNLIWSKHAWNYMPQGMVSCIVHAAAIYYRMFGIDHVTVGVDVGFNSVDGQHLAVNQGAEGRFNYTTEPYSAVESALESRDPGLVLPATDPTGGAGVDVSWAQMSALGLGAARPAETDGYVGFRYESYYNLNTDHRAEPGQEDFTGIALHEISEAMGRRTDPDAGTSSNPGGGETILDLTRYAAPGTLATNSSPNAYFSVDGGTTNLASYNTNPLGDFGDWAYPGAGVDAFRGGITPDTVSTLSPTDHALMAALGFTPHAY